MKGTAKNKQQRTDANIYLEVLKGAKFACKKRLESWPYKGILHHDIFPVHDAFGVH